MRRFSNPDPGLTGVKLDRPKDNFGRNEFMSEMFSVQIGEVAREI